MVVEDRSIRPAGREPLSASTPHSKPREPGAIDRVELPDRDAAAVFRQKRSPANREVSDTVSVRVALTMKILPLSAFSGRPPSAGGLNRRSRQVPVHVGGSAGSMTALACVSLYATIVRFGVFEPSMLFSQRVFQKILLPLKNA